MIVEHNLQKLFIDTTFRHKNLVAPTYAPLNVDSSSHTITTVLQDKDKKKNYCMYCNKLVAKLPRHLEAIHQAEEDVQKLSSLPKGTFRFLQLH